MMRCPKCCYTVLDNNMLQCPACIYKAKMVCVDDVDDITKAQYHKDCEAFKFIFSDGYEPNNSYVPPTQEELDKLERQMKTNQFLDGWKKEREANKPKCPTCGGSTNIEKISTTKKVVGGALFGLFSSDVRKTMHCKNCGYKW